MSDKASKEYEESWIADLLANAGKYDPTPFVSVDLDNKRIEFRANSGGSVYLRWIAGLPGDCGLLIDQETGKAVGVHLPMHDHRLAVFHHGPLKINEGFFPEPADQKPSEDSGQ